MTNCWPGCWSSTSSGQSDRGQRQVVGWRPQKISHRGTEPQRQSRRRSQRLLRRGDWKHTQKASGPRHPCLCVLGGFVAYSSVPLCLCVRFMVPTPRFPIPALADPQENLCLSCQPPRDLFREQVLHRNRWQPPAVSLFGKLVDGFSSPRPPDGSLGRLAAGAEVQRVTSVDLPPCMGMFRLAAATVSKRCLIVLSCLDSVST
jgi:hypothetical protein